MGLGDQVIFSRGQCVSVLVAVILFLEHKGSEVGGGGGRLGLQMEARGGGGWGARWDFREGRQDCRLWVGLGISPLGQHRTMLGVFHMVVMKFLEHRGSEVRGGTGVGI